MRWRCAANKAAKKKPPTCQFVMVACTMYTHWQQPPTQFPRSVLPLGIAIALSIRNLVLWKSKHQSEAVRAVCSLIWDLGLGKPVPHYLPKMVKTYLKLVFCLKRQARTPGTDQCYFWLYCTFLLRGISQPDSDIPSARYPTLPLQQPPASNVSTDATASLSCNYKKASITTAKIVTRHTFPFY